jgi:hypothetical protein
MTDPTLGFDNDTLLIDETDLRGEYSRMARTLKAWLDVLADTTDEKRSSKLTLMRTKKAVELSIKQRPDKPTEKVAEAEIESHPLVISAGDTLLQAERIEDRVNAIVDSLKTKRAMLMTLGGLVRTEMETDRFTS